MEKNYRNIVQWEEKSKLDISCGCHCSIFAGWILARFGSWQIVKMNFIVIMRETRNGAAHQTKGCILKISKLPRNLPEINLDLLPTSAKFIHF